MNSGPLRSGSTEGKGFIVVAELLQEQFEAQQDETASPAVLSRRRGCIRSRAVLSRVVLGAVCVASSVIPAYALAAGQAVGGTPATPVAGQSAVPQAAASQAATPQAANPIATQTATPTSTGPAAAAATPAQNLAAAKPDPTVAPLDANLGQYEGLKVSSVQFTGVDFSPNDRTLTQLMQKEGETFDPDKVRQSTRRLFATGRYRNIDVRVIRSGDTVAVTFGGVPRYYVGRIQVDGIKEDRLASLVEYGTNLNPGTAFTPSDVEAATNSVKQTLASNGYYEPKIAVRTDRDDNGQQVNVTYTIAIGPLARVGNVAITGKDPGITEKDFRKKGKLKRKSKVGRETISNALSNLRDFYQKKDHLEATVSLQASTYDPATKTLNYDFTVEQGPVVQVKVEGAKFSKSRLHLLVPVYEEGTVDNDLLNEGSFNMKDYLQQSGYFDPHVSVQQLHPGTGGETVLYTVSKGEKQKVGDVTIDGNKYFTTELLKESLRIQKANAYQRAGRYSTQLVAADESSIQALYRANGFSLAKVTSSTSNITTKPNGKPLKVAEVRVSFHINEGPQQTFGNVAINGADPSRLPNIQGMLQATAGQPFSLVTLSGDRDTVLAYYLSNGFDKARIEVTQVVDPSDKLKTKHRLQRHRRRTGLHGQGARKRRPPHPPDRGCGADQSA